MAELAQISNTVVRDEIGEFVDRADERAALIARFASVRPEVQEVAAAVIRGDHRLVDLLVTRLLEQGARPLEVMDDGLIAGMAVVGIKFRDNYIFVPEVLACARGMKTGMTHVEGLLADAGVAPVGSVLFGTVKGDLHDIGKNLCIMLLRGAGFQVADLGIDVPPERFVDAIREHQPQVVALSALLTTTMPAMTTTIEAIQVAGLRAQVRVLVGGAPLSQAFADEIGADGYGKDAAACVEVARQLTVGRPASA